MPRFNDRLLDGLDAAAERTGVPGLVISPRRRHLYWLPVITLALATGGTALGLARTDLQAPAFAIAMAGFALSVFLPIFGPIKPWGGAEKVDEYDRAMRARAFLVTFASISVAAVFGIWLIIGLALLGKWPNMILISELSSLALYLMTLHSTVPTLYSSWATRPIGED